MAHEPIRILIEDEEDNFLYLDVRAPLTDVALLLEIINRSSSGRAKIERKLAREAAG